MLIDTAGIRPRGKHASSVEVFSVMLRTYHSPGRALCSGDRRHNGRHSAGKKIAALMQKAHKPSLLVVNKWDLVKPERRAKATLAKLINETHERLFFLPMLPSWSPRR